MIFLEAFLLLSAGLALASPLRSEAVHREVARAAAAPPGSTITGWVPPGSDDFIDISVWHHNVHRANHSAPPVAWNDTLFQWAQKKAKTCQYNDAIPNGWDDVGINIAGGSGQMKNGPNPSGMISGLWYNSEEMNYPKYGVGNPPYGNFENWGHFSQLVWPDSRQIGCGLAICNNGNSWFGLCIYSPPGNWEGEFDEIGRPKGNPPVYPNGQDGMKG